MPFSVARGAAPTVSRVLTAFAILAAVRPALADPRPRFVNWMAPESAVSANSDEASLAGDDGGTADGSADGGSGPDAADAGDGGFVNHGYVPWQGGPIITQLKVVAVFWGNNVDPQVVSGIGGFYSVLTSSSFMHFVSEYWTPLQTPGAYGSFVGGFTIVPNNTATTLADANILTELAEQIGAGALPPADPNTVFMVHLPPGVNINDPAVGQSCVPSGFCGYHKSGNGIIYSVLPDFSQGGCAPGPSGCTSCCGDRTPFETATSISSHELMESVTDPLPRENLAWDNVLFGEIGDLCQYARRGERAYTTVVSQDGRTTYTAQRGWSNAAYVAHMGNPPGTGCVDYPTTLCCNDANTNCGWLPNGSRTCPNPTGDSPDASTVPNGIVVTAPTLGGFGSALMMVERQPVHRLLPVGVTDWLVGGVESPIFNISASPQVTLSGGANACFAAVTNATQRGIFQCAPLVPSVPCRGPAQQIESTESGPLCCTNLGAQTSPDGTQLCATLANFGTGP